MKKILFIFLLFFFNFSFACLNYIIVGTDIHGGKIETDGANFPNFQIGNIDKKQYQSFADDDLKMYQNSKDLRYYVNYGTSLVFLGEYEKAISIFQEIDKKQPNLYEVASNLGTTYELIGDNKNALLWIEKALKLNTESHHGSEWIHVAILKKKLGIINSDNILNLDFGDSEIPKTKLNEQELQRLVDDLSYQVSERNKFVKPKENIVGRLYFDLGNSLALNLDLESALKAYNISKQYGYQNPILDKRIKYFQKLISENSDSGKEIDIDQRNENIFFTIVALLGLLVIAISIFIVKRFKKK